MFWATGALSSFLDNTPTYLVFLTTAGTLGLTGGITTALGQIPVNLLEAISCGAVFMGANTYIGNAPNFMVKCMSDENGVRMPSFFRIYGMVTDMSGTGIYYRYAGILFVRGGAEHGK